MTCFSVGVSPGPSLLPPVMIIVLTKKNGPNPEAPLKMLLTFDYFQFSLKANVFAFYSFWEFSLGLVHNPSEFTNNKG